MFAVHSSNGVVYKGSLEEITRRKAAKRRKTIPKSSFWETNTPQSQVVAFTPPSNQNRYQHAEELYRRMLRVKVHQPMIHAHQIMSSHIYTLSPDDLLSDALRRFDQFEVKQMPVVNDTGEVISMVGESDIRRFLVSEEGGLNRFKTARVAEICPKEIVTAEPVASIRRVAKVLGQYQQSGIPIVDENNRLVGFVSSGDILRTFANRNDINHWC